MALRHTKQHTRHRTENKIIFNICPLLEMLLTGTYRHFKEFRGNAVSQELEIVKFRSLKNSNIIITDYIRLNSLNRIIYSIIPKKILIYNMDINQFSSLKNLRLIYLDSECDN